MVTVGIPAETSQGERRVAAVPAVIPALIKSGVEVVVEAGAGDRAGFSDAAFLERGARIAASRDEVFAARVVLCVDTLAHRASLTGAHTVLGFCRPLLNPEALQALADTGATAFAVELMPRITRAQSMDALSSQATVSGYRAVLVAAAALPRMFPLMTTAAGTITPAKVLVVGTGVAGLQAIATARRLGAVVQAYDVRPAAREQVESLGAKFVELPLEAGNAEDAAGYARELDDDFYRRQQELMTQVVAGCDVVITTALLPGRKAPVLITAPMVAGMPAGSVVVDLAAEQGGNCELTVADQVVIDHGVTIMGPTSLPSSVAADASLMYAKNLTAFVTHLLGEAGIAVDMDDEITRETLVTRGGEVVNARVREALGASAPSPAAAAGLR